MSQLVIKDQLLNIFRGWGVTELPPTKGKQVVVNFPPPAVLNLCTVNLHDAKSTYGKPLYRLEFSNKQAINPA